VLPLALLALLGCNDDPNEPSTGSLALVISGLPAGAAAAVSVVGPEGFAQSVGSSRTFFALAPGAYTVVAAPVSASDGGYAAVPDTQTITVAASSASTVVAVDYVLAIGRLSVAVTGLPGGTGADVEVTGPGFHHVFTADSTVTELAPGEYTVVASSVTIGATLYNPSPRSQTVRVTSSALPASASVGYQMSTAGNFNLAIDGMYLVQSTQTYRGSVPLVAGRAALLRVFVVANSVNGAQPAVRVRLYRNNVLIDSSVIPGPGLAVPTDVDEGDLGSSWNFVIPASRVVPGLAVVADVDPGGAVQEGNETDNVYPASGTPARFDVRTVPPLRVRFVPVHQSANGRLGEVTPANRDQFLSATLRMHPVAHVSADVRGVYTTAVAPLDRSDDEEWGKVLSEVNALRLVDPDAAGVHYYGVVNTSYTSGIAGLAYVGGRSAVGWDYLPSGASVAAHEFGHNWGRHHAPCGDVSRPDLQYPYPGGNIGAYGFDLSTGTVKPSSSTDLMGYCASQWISDYTYLGVLGFRNASPVTATAAAPGVLVWGRIVDGEPVLEPMFQVTARPSLPERAGPYAVEGRTPDGSRLFGLSFAADEVADTRRGDRHFAFVVPLPPERAARVATLRFSGPQRSISIAAARPTGPSFRVGKGPGEAAVRRLAAGRIALRWDAVAHPMVLVRDPATGRVLSFARGGNAEVVTERDEVELVASDRVQSESVRVRIAP
jgi:hypothetical protein